MNKLLLFASILLVLTSSCKKEPEIDDSLLDGDVLFDPSLYNPEAYLVSAKYPQPTTSDLNKHVILAIHGYSASTFEWDEFREWSTDTNYRISQVLLGGHGRDYESFKVSSWQDWKSSIVDEYDKLIELGYTNISLVGSSTGGTLLLELTSSKYFENTLHPKNMFLIDSD